jgi:DNA-binding IclR family transcriptional regulator
MNKDSEKSKYQVPNLDRALRIMEFLSENSSGATKAEIARQLKYPNNSVFRIICTLENSGYVIRNEDSNEYSLSRKMLSLGYKALVEKNLVELAVDILRMMRDETRETALLGALLDGEGVVLEQELSPEPIKFMVSPGTRFMLHTAAPGKAMLAWLDERECERQISHIDFVRFNSRTICTPDAYRKELENVRQKGYALDIEEEAEGVICIGAPVFDYRGMVKAAIWITGPKFRLSDDRIQKTGETVKKYGQLLSKRMGFQN